MTTLKLLAVADAGLWCLAYAAWAYGLLGPFVGRDWTFDRSMFAYAVSLVAAVSAASLAFGLIILAGL